MTMLDKVRNCVDAHDVISFDIFDTLLLRPYVKPTDLFSHLEHIHGLCGYRDARVQAELRARQLHRDKEDITLEDIYEELEAPFKGMMQAELDMERRVLYPNPEMKEVYEYALQAGKKVVITSDMYLPQDFLESVLAEKGYKGHAHFYLSCAVNKTKWNGTLYRHLLDELNTEPSRVLHIGDNRQSDVEMAESLGLTAREYPKAMERLLQDNERAAEFLEEHADDVQASILLGLLSIYSLREKENYWQDFGFKYAGPVAYGYMQWIKSQLKKDGISQLMFVARDGYTLQKVFDIIKPEGVRTHYFYTPRIVNLACNLNYEDNRSFDEEQGLLAIRLILSYFKDKHPFLKENTPDINSYAEGDAFVCKHRELFEELAAREKDEYRRYIDQFKLADERVGLVDTCTIMLSAQKALITGLPDKHIHGYYWFLWGTDNRGFEKYAKSAYQTSTQQEFVDWNMMELYMTAPTPPIDRIEDGQAIFKEANPSEKRRMEIYPDLSQGMVDYARFAHGVFLDIQLYFDAQVLVDWTNVLCRVVTEKDKAAFATVQHACDAAHTRYVPMPWPWFSLPLVRKRVSALKLFNFIPLFRKKEEIGKRRQYYLFGILPLMTVKQREGVSRYRLFGFLPILKLKRREIRPGSWKISCSLLGVSLIHLLRDVGSDAQEKVRVYFLHVRVLTKRSRSI